MAASVEAGAVTVRCLRSWTARGLAVAAGRRFDALNGRLYGDCEILIEAHLSGELLAVDSDTVRVELPAQSTDHPGLLL